MPSSYTPSLRLTLPVTGELAGTWGDTVNTGITNLVDASVAGTAAVTMTDADYTLTSVNGATDEARKMFVTLTGTLTAARNVICPSASKLYFIKNTTTGGYAVTLKTSAGTGISVPNGKSMVLYCDATNVVDATNHYSSITIATALAATSGGTGQASYTTGDLLYASSSTALSKLGVGTAGQVLTSSGTAPQWSTLSGVAVTTFSAGTTGFTPSTATSGAITLAGTLATTNGGTGLTSFTANGILYASSSSALATGSALTFDGTTFGMTVNALFNNSRVLQWKNTSGVTRPVLQVFSDDNLYIDSEDGAQVFRTLGSERMRLTSTGLGIGTSSPSAKLELASTSAGATVELLRLSNDGAGANTQAQIKFASNAVSYGTITGGYGASAPQMTFNLPSGTPGNYVWQISSTEVMRLNTAGNLGIGTSSPSNRLSVSGTGVAIAKITDTSATGYSGLTFAGTGTQNYSIGVGGPSETALTVANKWFLYDGLAGAMRMVVDTSGNVGIGTSSPSSRLDVQGTTAIQPYFRLKAATGSTGGFNRARIGLYNNAASATGWDITETGDGNDALVFDSVVSGTATSRMTLDSSGNLGLGVTPQVWGSNYRAIEVAGATSGNLVAYVNALNIGTGFRNDNTNFIYTNSIQAPTWYGQNLGAHRWYTAPVGTSGNTISFTNVMTLDASGNLGIGTSSPTTKLYVDSGAANTATFRSTGANPQITATDGTVTQYAGYTTGSRAYTGTGSNHPLGFITNNTEKMVLDTSGNLGLGVTPSAWASLTALQMPGGAISGIAGSQRFEMLQNAYYGTASSYYYTTTAAATGYRQSAGQHLWFNAASGTAGNAITFTQAMTLDANGVLFVGATGIGGAAKVRIQNTSNAGLYCIGSTISARFDSPTSGTETIQIINADTSGNNLFVSFYTETSPVYRGSITYDRGAGLISYGTSSDYRAKDILGPVQNPGATIDALKVYEGQMKGATQSRPMLVAHEAQAVTPYAVTGEKDAVNEDGTPNYQQMDVSSLVPLLIAEIQSLRARVAQLESKP